MQGSVQAGWPEALPALQPACQGGAAAAAGSLQLQLQGVMCTGWSSAFQHGPNSLPLTAAASASIAAAVCRLLPRLAFRQYLTWIITDQSTVQSLIGAAVAAAAGAGCCLR